MSTLNVYNKDRGLFNIESLNQAKDMFLQAASLVYDDCDVRSIERSAKKLTLIAHAITYDIADLCENIVKYGNKLDLFPNIKEWNTRRPWQESNVEDFEMALYMRGLYRFDTFEKCLSVEKFIDKLNTCDCRLRANVIATELDIVCRIILELFHPAHQRD